MFPINYTDWDYRSGIDTNSTIDFIISPHMINLNVTFHSEEAYAGSRFKLLILKARETEAYSLIIDVFLDFLNDFHSGTRSL